MEGVLALEHSTIMHWNPELKLESSPDVTTFCLRALELLSSYVLLIHRIGRVIPALPPLSTLVVGKTKEIMYVCEAVDSAASEFEFSPLE